MGTERAGAMQFAREIYAQLHESVNIPGISDHDLDLFIWDSPFNFSLKQALESLKDPNALAKVA